MDSAEAAAVCICSAVFKERILTPSPPRCDNMFSSSNDLTDTFSSSGACLKAVVTLAAVTSHRVDTAAVFADAGLGPTLVQVW